MKKILIITIIVLLVVISYFVFQQQKESVPTVSLEQEQEVQEELTEEELMEVTVFFGNTELNSEALCEQVFPVARQIVKTEGVARAALTELLKGPTLAEEKMGYFTNINQGVKIQSLTIENGIAKVDFDEQLEFQIGGSCRVIAIRAEIEQTLKQFSTVTEVIISINGRVDDILQP